jgi:hypothetical protein
MSLFLYTEQDHFVLNESEMCLGFFFLHSPKLHVAWGQSIPLSSFPDTRDRSP